MATTSWPSRKLPKQRDIIPPFCEGPGFRPGPSLRIESGPTRSSTPAVMSCHYVGQTLRPRTRPPLRTVQDPQPKHRVVRTEMPCHPSPASHPSGGSQAASRARRAHADEVDGTHLLPESDKGDREWADLLFQTGAVGARLAGWWDEWPPCIVAARAVRVDTEDVTQGAQAGDDNLAIPAHSAHGLGGYLTRKGVVRLFADGRAEGLEFAPDMLIFTIDVAFKVVHGS